MKKMILCFCCLGLVAISSAVFAKDSLKPAQAKTEGSNSDACNDVRNCPDDCPSNTRCGEPMEVDVYGEYPTSDTHEPTKDATPTSKQGPSGDGDDGDDGDDGQACDPASDPDPRDLCVDAYVAEGFTAEEARDYCYAFGICMGKVVTVADQNKCLDDLPCPVKDITSSSTSSEGKGKYAHQVGMAGGVLTTAGQTLANRLAIEAEKDAAQNQWRVDLYDPNNWYVKLSDRAEELATKLGVKDDLGAILRKATRILNETAASPLLGVTLPCETYGDPNAAWQHNHTFD